MKVTEELFGCESIDPRGDDEDFDEPEPANAPKDLLVELAPGPTADACRALVSSIITVNGWDYLCLREEPVTHGGLGLRFARLNMEEK